MLWRCFNARACGTRSGWSQACGPVILVPFYYNVDFVVYRVVSDDAWSA